MAPSVPLRMLAAAALATVVLLVSALDSDAATAGCATASAATAGARAPQAARAVRCLVNAQRVRHGLAPLHPSRRLRIAAERHGADMVGHGFFAHVSPFAGALSDRARRAGYLSGARDWALGENIAWGEGDLASPAAIVDAWMHSPGHRAVILDRDFTDVGVGAVPGVPVQSDLGGATFVLDAGSAF
jgi:uncharacterized protein YkwD